MGCASYGGAGCGKFYASEYSRIERHHADNTPASGFTPDQLEAGYEKLNRTFGFFGILVFLEKETSTPREKILKWSVAEFKLNLRYIAWTNEINKRYGEILEKKRKKP